MSRGGSVMSWALGRRPLPVIAKLLTALPRKQDRSTDHDLVRFEKWLTGDISHRTVRTLSCQKS